MLVLRRLSRLPSGHVAVVSRVRPGREILVTQANWVHHRVTADQPVVDVSQSGDWSLVRVWWPPAERMGTTDYPTSGFIRGERPMDHEMLMTEIRRVISVAMGGG
jgi:hypothetical protein